MFDFKRNIKNITESVEQVVNTVSGKIPVDDIVKLEEAMRRLDSIQTNINIEEAKHKSIFISGWRPAIGWICVLGFAYSIFAPIFSFLAFIFWGSSSLPGIDDTAIQSMLFGMLGLGGFRSIEKIKGVARS